MAISHAYPMFLLILSLFLLPTLLAIPFEECVLPSSFTVTGVETIREGDQVSFNITGYTNKVITGGFVELKVQISFIYVVQRGYDLCELITCPVSPGGVVVPISIAFPWDPRLNFKVYINISEDPDDDEIVCLIFDVRTPNSAAISA